MKKLIKNLTRKKQPKSYSSIDLLKESLDLPIPHFEGSAQGVFFKTTNSLRHKDDVKDINKRLKDIYYNSENLAKQLLTFVIKDNITFAQLAKLLNPFFCRLYSVLMLKVYMVMREQKCDLYSALEELTAYKNIEILDIEGTLPLSQDLVRLDIQKSKEQSTTSDLENIVYTTPAE